MIQIKNRNREDRNAKKNESGELKKRAEIIICNFCQREDFGGNFLRKKNWFCCGKCLTQIGTNLGSELKPKNFGGENSEK